MAAGNSGEWNVSEESVEKLKQLAQLLKELAEELAGTVSTLRDDFAENEKGLGAHSEDIIALIEDMEKLAGESSAVVNKLSFKLLKAAAVRQSHIDNSVYSGKGRGGIGAGAFAAGMAGAAGAVAGGAVAGGASSAGAGQAGGSGGTGGGLSSAEGSNGTGGGLSSAGGFGGTGGSSPSAGGSDGTGGGSPSAGGSSGISSSAGGAGTSGAGSGEFTSIVASLEGANVAYRPIEPALVARTTEQIVERLSGGDLTEGSCSSLAFAYAGNKAGYDVLDFRDGGSRSFFATRTSIQKIADLPGVQSTVLCGQDDFDSAGRLFGGMESGKEYYLAIGQHAAIVRRNGDHIEYLELQHPSGGNGWHELSAFLLEKRFGCSRARSFAVSSFLLEVDSLTKCREFLRLLGYINTEGSQQRKGVSGNVR